MNVSADALGFFSERYALDTTVMASIVSAALERGGDFAELYFEHRVQNAIVWEDQQVKSANHSAVGGVGIRVVNGESIGYAYSESLEPEAMRKAAATAARVGRSGTVKPPIDATPAGLDGRSYDSQAPLTLEPPADKVALLERADRAARSFDPSVARVDASIGDELKHVAIARSDGTVIGDVQPLIRFNVQVLSLRDGERQVARTGGGGRLGIEYFRENPPEDQARAAPRQAVLQQNALEAPAGSMPVVLAAGDSGILLHEAIGHGLEADFNRKGTSNYSGRMGEPVASPLVTVIDDGTIARSRGSIHVDDEGNAAKENVLIENGVLRSYLHDEMSARHFGVSPSGSGRRESFRDYVMPRMTNTFMLGSEDHPEDIVRSVSQGIYCISFNGGQVNISNGDFVFSVTEAYLIEDGRITRPIRNVNLIGNGPEVLSRVSMVGSDYVLSDGRWTCGKDGQSVPVGVGIPTVLVSEMTVGGTSA
ncbi:MAG: TldD/PmbA family protein [Dehalococcoidia bacterium]